MTEKSTFAICAAILFAVLALGIMMSGPGASRGMIALALLLGGASQYLAQSENERIIQVAESFAGVAIIFAGVATTYYAMEAIF